MSDLYQTDLLRLAAAADGAGRLSEPRATATLDNPLCGDRVTVDVRLQDGRIEELAHETKACVVCQAASAMIARHAKGRTAGEIAAVRAAIEATLKGEEPPAAWPEIELFRPIARVKSRHACVRLPFRALQAALEGEPGG